MLSMTVSGLINLGLQLYVSLSSFCPFLTIVAQLLATLKQAPYNALNKAQRVALATVLFKLVQTGK